MASVLCLCLAALSAVASGLLGTLPQPPPLPPPTATPTASSAASVSLASQSRTYISDEQAGAAHSRSSALLQAGATHSRPLRGDGGVRSGSSGKRGERSRSQTVGGTQTDRRGASGLADLAGDLAGSPESFGTLEEPFVSSRWVAGFYRIYEEAEKAFHVNWLLIASIHSQETAFSTAEGTYHGLNYLHCCGGPMQFNVRNGPVSTWDLVADSYRYAPRPRFYNHMTKHHPSIYDDFDAIMAAAHLLSLDGASYALNDSAWWAAYDYYGHGEGGVIYADEVLARAINWSQRGFCPTCTVPGSLLDAVDAAYGAPVLSALRAQAQRGSAPAADASTQAAARPRGKPGAEASPRPAAQAASRRRARSGP